MSELIETAVSATSEQIFGRNKELKLISEALSKSENSRTSLIVIEGPAGIGKTTVIQKALEKYSHKKCFKLFGKFENHRENTPYLAFRQAFDLWGQQILLLSDEDFDNLKESTTSALQTNIAAVTEVFHELEVFFSRKQLTKDNYKAVPLQIKARFYYFLKKFFRSITSLGYRLIFFLDDLQWADKASFNLLEELVGKNEIPGLLFVTSIRTQNDLPVKQAEKLKSIINLPNTGHIILKPLSRSSIGAMIPTQWKFTRQNLDNFKNYIWLESGGNPFRINEILKIIQREKLVSGKAKDPVFWESLPRLGVSEDSVAFIREQLQNLSFHHIQVISTASCLGYSFESALLKKILPFPENEIDSILLDLIKMDFIIKNKKIFVFSHDTIFSAANSLLSNIEKRDLHQKTGVYLLGKIENYDQPEFFKAVNHINKANDLTTSEKVYSDEHILLNIQAARLAVGSSAFEVAHQYYLIAEKLIDPSDLPVKIKDPVLISIFENTQVSKDHLQFLILYGRAETMFLLHKFEAALEFSARVLELNCTRHQRLQATLIKIMICSALIHQKNIPHILEDGIASLERVLNDYGIIIPKDRESIKKESAEESQILARKTIGFNEHTNFTQLLNPNKEYQDLMNLVTTSMTFVYYIDSYKCLSMVSKTLLMTLDKGFAPVTPILFSASFFTGFFSEENRSLAYLLGKLSLKMIETEPFQRQSYRVHYIAILNFYCWEHSYRSCVKKLKEGILLANEAGDPHYASFCYTIVRILNSYRGKNLVKHLEECKKVEKDHHVFFISSADGALIDYLTGKKPGFEEGNFLFPEAFISEAQHNLTSRYSLLLAQQKLNYLSGYYNAALKAGEACDELENVGSGFQIELEHFFYFSLILLQSVYKNGYSLSKAMLKISPKLKEFRRLSTFRSGNFLHKAYLIEAEIAKCRGDFEQATLRYDEAIKEAKEQGFLHHAAISAERAFEYYLNKGRNKVAEVYLNKSLRYYKRWGAHAKMEQLKKRFSSFVKEKGPADKFLPAARYETIRKILSRSIPETHLELPQLAQSLVSLIFKEGQAKKAAIFLFQENSWNLLAADPLNNSIINKPLRELTMDFPASALNYCINKGEKVELQDIFRNKLFAQDPYLTGKKPLNISIFPILQSGETIGLIYLENCFLASEAEKNLFLVMVELVSTTFANAVFYKSNDLLNKELKVQERNRIEATIESQEKERQRIARELHDSLGQILALTRISLSSINYEKIEQDNEILLNKIKDLIDESCREIRTISHNLMPPDLNNRNISEILENLIFKNRDINGILYEYHLHEPKTVLSVACKFTLYRVLQEIIQNIIKHASASKVTISLTEADEFVNLLVEDNGKGFDTKITSLGLGLKNIHSRVKMLDGYLDIDSSINNGTVFSVSIPIKP